MVTRLVIDTNVLLDCWVFDDARARPLWQSVVQADLQPLRSADTDAELKEVLARSQFNLDPARQHALLSEWQGRATLIERVFPAPWGCTDPRDQKFLDLANTARATLLVSKDKALLKSGRRSVRDGLRVVTPEQWSSGAAQRRAERRSPIDCSAGES